MSKRMQQSDADGPRSATVTSSPTRDDLAPLVASLRDLDLLSAGAIIWAGLCPPIFPAGC